MYAVSGCSGEHVPFRAIYHLVMPKRWTMVAEERLLVMVYVNNLPGHVDTSIFHGPGCDVAVWGFGAMITAFVGWKAARHWRRSMNVPTLTEIRLN
jgi:hypothetical protein